MSSLSSSPGTVRSNRASDDELKYRAMNFVFSDFDTIRCNPQTCKFNGICISHLQIGPLLEFRRAFWGNKESIAPTTSDRRTKVMEMLSELYCKATKTFVYKVPSISPSVPDQEVCEAAFAIALGISQKPNASEINNMWKWCKKEVIDPQQAKTFSNNIKVARGLKLNNAGAYIRLARDSVCDDSPYAGMENTKILPHETLTAFYLEYKRYCAEKNISDKEHWRNTWG